MSSTLADLLDFQKAWSRVKRDQSQDTVFVPHPLMPELVDTDSASWLSALRDDVSTGDYAPKSCSICAVPKPNGATRPGGILSLRDQTMYAALVHATRPAVQELVDWGSPPPDFGYRLKTDLEDKDWFQPYFPLWKAFDSKSVDYVKEGLEWVVVADIAGYYENIDLFLLRSDLSALDVEGEVVSLLHKCLNRWTRVQRRGIPQGFSASNVLGKVYLNSVDRSLSASGLTHIRWVDDYRIFCKTESDAREALVLLIDLLGSRGLVVQSAKTSIISKEKAVNQFNAVHSLVEPIKTKFVEELRKAGALNVPSASVADIDRALRELSADMPMEVVRLAFDDHIASDRSRFNKTLFRFLVRRLASGHDDHALSHALSLLYEHPEETSTILSYAGDLDKIGEAESAYMALVIEGRASYDYQSFEVLTWRLFHDAQPADDFLAWARSLAVENGTRWFVRAAARMVMGKWGAAEDLEVLLNCYGSASSDIERAEIICSVSRMEKSKRNAFLGHAASDGDLPSRAARLVRERRMSWDAS